MRTKQVDIYQRYTPIPIAVLITAANCFDCDIYIDNGKSKVNVKDYDEMKKGLVTRNRNLLFTLTAKMRKPLKDGLRCYFNHNLSERTPICHSTPMISGRLTPYPVFP